MWQFAGMKQQKKRDITVRNLSADLKIEQVAKTQRSYTEISSSSLEFYDEP